MGLNNLLKTSERRRVSAVTLSEENVAFCVRDECKQPIEAVWAFCPYCGEDNRPPHNRNAVVACRHKFVSAGGFCFTCGGDAVQPPAAEISVAPPPGTPLTLSDQPGTVTLQPDPPSFGERLFMSVESPLWMR